MTKNFNKQEILDDILEQIKDHPDFVHLPSGFDLASLQDLVDEESDPPLLCKLVFGEEK